MIQPVSVWHQGVLGGNGKAKKKAIRKEYHGPNRGGEGGEEHTNSILMIPERKDFST